MIPWLKSSLTISRWCHLCVPDFSRFNNNKNPVLPNALGKNCLLYQKAVLSTNPQHSIKMLITRGFSLTNFVIGTSSLAFSAFVLYPWHHRLDNDFAELMADRKLKESQRLEELQKISGSLEKLEAMGKARYEKGWHWL